MSSLPHSSLSLEASRTVEQRLFVRKKLQKPLPIELLPGKEVWLDDLGEGGLGVSGSSRLEPGTVTFLTFQFPEANSLIEATGVVAWCNASGRVGVRFTRIKQDSTAALKRWLKDDAGLLGERTGVPAGGAAEPPPQIPRSRFGVEDLKQELAAARDQNTSTYDLLADRMLRATRATGAAIALRNRDRVLCRATAGNAPNVGTELNTREGLSAECYRSGNIVSVSDSEIDLRVDAEVCRQLDFRSLLIVPVTLRAEVVGIAEVFSPLPGNFEGGDILSLSAISELIAENYEQEQTQAIPEIKVAFDVSEPGDPRGVVAESGAKACTQDPSTEMALQQSDSSSGTTENFENKTEQPGPTKQSGGGSEKPNAARHILGGALLMAIALGIAGSKR